MNTNINIFGVGGTWFVNFFSQVALPVADIRTIVFHQPGTEHAVGQQLTARVYAYMDPADDASDPYVFVGPQAEAVRTWVENQEL